MTIFPIYRYRITNGGARNSANIQPLIGEKLTKTERDNALEWLTNKGYQASILLSGIHVIASSKEEIEKIPEPTYETKKSIASNHNANKRKEKKIAINASYTDYLDTTPAGQFVTNNFDGVNTETQWQLAKYLAEETTSFKGIGSNKLTNGVLKVLNIPIEVLQKIDQEIGYLTALKNAFKSLTNQSTAQHMQPSEV